MFRHVSEILKNDKGTLEEYIPILTFIARKYPPSWLYLASIYEEKGPQQNLDAAKDAIKHFLETAYGTDNEQRDGWSRLATLCRRTDDYSGEVRALLQTCLIPGASFQICSGAVHRINGLFNQEYTLDTEEKQTVGEKLAEVMANRIKEGDATDCSRLAWLYIHLGDKQSAQYYTESGLEQDPYNTYCLKLTESLGINYMP